MDVVLLQFVDLLRGAGVRVSPAETLDAARGLAATTLRERETVRTALRTTLVKDQRDQPAFDDLFDRFFAIAPFEEEEPDQPAPAVGELRALEDDDARGPKESGAAELVDLFAEDDHEPPGEAQRMDQEEDGVDLGAEGEELRIGEATEEGADLPRHILHMDHVGDVGEAGELALGEGESVDVGMEAEGLPQMPGSGAGDPDEELVEDDVGTITGLPELLRRHLEKLREEQAATSDGEDVAAAYRMTFTPEEERRLDELLRQVGREMRGAQSPRRSTGSRGRIQPARTMRAALRTQGLPFRPVTADRRPDRPRLVVLVDVSLSVRNTARFTLHLVHGLQELFSQVRTFAFVADVVEVTAHLRRTALDEALGTIFGGELLDVEASSDYGGALGAFHDRHLGCVNRRSLVIVLGDGRGNGNPANAWALQELARRAGRLVWLTPEKERHRRLGTSDMEEYAPHCDRVEQVRDLDQLEAVAASVLVGR